MNTDILLTLVPTNPNYPETVADLIEAIRRFEGWSLKGNCQIISDKNGIIVRVERDRASFEWAIDYDGKTYFKAWD